MTRKDPRGSDSLLGEHLARTTDDITAEWLTAVLRDAVAMGEAAVTDVEITPLGTGQAGLVVRVVPRYDRDLPGTPRSAVVKLASTDDVARGTGVALGIYEAEVRFYREIAPSLDVAVPRCFNAAVQPETGWFTLVLEDLSTSAVPGDTVRGDTPERAALALDQLVRLHAAHWNDEALRGHRWLDPARTIALLAQAPRVLPVFMARFGDRLEPAHRDVCERVMQSAEQWTAAAWTAPFVLQHGDFRLDNMLFGTTTKAPPVTVIDWQAVKIGPPMVDVSLYVGGSLSIDDRRRSEEPLVRGYHDHLTAAGVDYAWDRCWEDYRLQSLYGLIAWVASCAHVQRTERGDELYLGGVQRHAAQALDLDAAGLLERRAEGG